jgi:hypothetical protein
LTPARQRSTAAAAALAVALACGACRDDDGAVLLVVVTVEGSPRPVRSLSVMLNGPAGSHRNPYQHAGERPITFPTTLIAEIPARATGDITIDVRADDENGATVATGHESVTIRAGERKTVYVRLDCGGETCVADGGVGPQGDGGQPPSGPSCGNGRIDPGETCDKAIDRGDPGACPPADCDDGIACTRDIRSGSDCTAVCTPEPILERKFGDACCPYMAGPGNDGDCPESCGNSIVDPGEICDMGVTDPSAPGYCPRLEDCTAPMGSCETAMLVSEDTCSAVCVRTPVVMQIENKIDGCCPAGATHTTDDDCPAVCGDGVRDMDVGEACDVGIPPLNTGACPRNCDDGDACTTDLLTGAGCSAACVRLAITAFVSGDGCCPKDATHATDTDCAPRCGDGVVDPGEACDPNAPVGRGACPTDCPPRESWPHDCLRFSPKPIGKAADCTARCVLEPVTECSTIPDRCCPRGCTWPDDMDCSDPMFCGDGFRAENANREKCEIGANPGSPDACLTSCQDDGDVCTENRLLVGGICQTECAFPIITSFTPGDGCCPDKHGANFAVDADCPRRCGDGVVDAPIERCDYGVVGGSCPAGIEECPRADACTRYEYQGVRTSCTATCVARRIQACSLAGDGDGCCPAGCTAANDKDCPGICGDGVVGADERCDRAITAGMPGACARTCDDGNACTVDQASGSVAGCSRSCFHHPVTGCIDGDGCCPAGCGRSTDNDCQPMCGDGRIGGGETCDPPATCPTACPDDGDACTVERLQGSAANCDVACVRAAVTACSGSTADSCCPTGCTFTTDTDC